jgi:hypothetical protein
VCDWELSKIADIDSMKNSIWPIDTIPLPTAGDNPDGLSTASAAEGAFLMAPDFQPWITRIDPQLWTACVVTLDVGLTTPGLEQPCGRFLTG